MGLHNPPNQQTYKCSSWDNN